MKISIHKISEVNFIVLFSILFITIPLVVADLYPNPYKISKIILFEFLIELLVLNFLFFFILKKKL